MRPRTIMVICIISRNILHLTHVYQNYELFLTVTINSRISTKNI